MNFEDDLPLARARAITRRQFFGGMGLGLGSIALNTLLQSEGSAAPIQAPSGPMSPKKPMIPQKAKAVIYLHMAGSPSQLELFEYKPELMKYDGKDCPEEFL